MKRGFNAHLIEQSISGRERETEEERVVTLSRQLIASQRAGGGGVASRVITMMSNLINVHRLENFNEFLHSVIHSVLRLEA